MCKRGVYVEDVLMMVWFFGDVVDGLELMRDIVLDIVNCLLRFFV